MMADNRGSARPLPPAIGRYRITSRLGKGSMGVVYGGIDDVMDRPVAVKVMMADLEEDPETSARFYREASAAGQLVHRNIITIFDMGEDDGRPFIVMELLDGDTLGTYLKKSAPCSLEHKIDLMLQICEGLRAAHLRGIYHRDVKPGNLVVSQDGCLKILDFGIARVASSSMTASGLIIGTPDYMSPEQAKGMDIDQRSDIFSAGAVFYFMLTGRKPFAAPDLPGVLNKVIREDPLPIRESEAPAAVAGIVTRALAKDPRHRYEDCEDMAADLARAARTLVAETRAAVLTLQHRLGDIGDLEAERSAIGARLKLAPSAAPSDSASDLRARFPCVLSQDDTPSEMAHHSQVGEARDVIEHVWVDLSAEVQRLREAERELSEGRRRMAGAQPIEALTHLEAAARLVDGAAVIISEAERCRALVAGQAANQRLARSVVRDARDAAARADWDVVLDLCSLALQTQPDLEDAAALRDMAVERKQLLSVARDAEGTRARAHARALARRGSFPEAIEALDAARRAAPASDDLPLCERDVEVARLEFERASGLERQAVEIIMCARQDFLAGRRRDALAALESFTLEAPESRLLQDEFERLRAEAVRLDEADRLAAEAATAAEAAERALAAGDAELALTLASASLDFDASYQPAVNVKARANAQLRASAEKRQRDEAVARHLTDACERLAAGKFQKARSAVARADALAPGDDGVGAVLREIEQAEARVRDAGERARIARQRAKAAAPVYAQARTAEANGDLVRAAWLAENALALDGACSEARALIERTRATLSAQPTLADETVDVAHGGGQPADPDDTVNILSAQPAAWRRVVGALRLWSGGQTEARRRNERLRQAPKPGSGPGV
ncbi:MAG: serine/threonine-protein kinase [Vicinamibacterales bacterium]